MATPDITFGLLDGTGAIARMAELQALHAEVYGDPPYLRGVPGGRPPRPAPRGDDTDVFPQRFGVQCRQPGFALAEARHGGYLVGYAAGMPLRPSTSWWRELTTPLPAELTTERPGRTFALLELMVRASWRRQGIGRALHDLLLRNRPEERATLTVMPTATAALTAFQSWGWRKVARTRGNGPDAPVSDVLIAQLSEATRIPSSKNRP